MERGARALVKIMLAAMLFGVVVIAFHPDYRAAFLALWRKQPEASPVWQSNALYYTEIGVRSE